MKKEISPQLSFTRVTSFFLILCLPWFTYSQERTELENIHQEVPDDPYVEVDIQSMQRSPAFRTLGSNFFTTQVNVDSNGNNIVGDAANEPSIAVDPTNPDRIVIGWRQFDTTSNNFRQAGYGYSLDGGQTFTFPGVLDPGLFRSDPVLDFDAQGNFYYNSLQGDFSCDVFKITDGGVVWDPEVPAGGGDKQWMRIDRTDGTGAGHNYSYWNSTFSTCPPGDFIRSTDGSNTFENCTIIGPNPRWGTLAVDKDGVLYASGEAFSASALVVKSLTARDPGSTVTWEEPVSVDLDGFLSVGNQVNPVGLLGQLWVDVDISDGPGSGNVYVLASVARISNSDPGDVMFAKSTDGGNTFTTGQRLNTDAGTSAYQWFGTMSVAPNGRIDVVWLDTRDAPAGTVDSVLYYIYSEDEGETWSDEEVLSAPFDPTIGYPQQDKMGDYFDMVSDNDGAHLAWANTLNGGQDVYYTRITQEVLSTDTFASRTLGLVQYPNPFTEETTLEFHVASPEQTIVEVFDVLGRRQAVLMDEVASGRQKIVWEGTGNSGQRLNSGIYFLSVRVGSNRELTKLVIQ